MIEIPKLDRDYSIFGEYDVTLGTRVFTSDTDFTSLGDFATSYYLEEPTYEYNEDEDELEYVTVDYKQWAIDVEEDFGEQGRGVQDIYVDFVISKNFAVADVLRIEMGLELPEYLLTEGKVVYQYVQLIGADLVEGTDDYISAGCQVTITDDESEEDTGKVENFEGTLLLKDAQT